MNRILNKWLLFLTIGFGSALFFTACNDADELDTNMLGSKETTLVAYGPNPALRGQNLTFVGTHLDQVTKVILPNNIEITNIEKINDKLIKVIVPQETVAGGFVRLIGPNNKELVGKDTLFILEPVSITKMSPQPVKAGQTLTLEGNYFNLITKIIFADKVEVDCKNFKVWERTKIELVLPAEAQTGVIILSDTAAIPLEYQSPEPLQVVLPSVTSILSLTNRKPGEVITAPGKDFDLIKSLEMPNGDNVAFTIENNALKFTLPENISDGAIAMIPASGVRVVAANVTVAMPGNIVVSPSTGIRAGTVITVRGVNMELVKSAYFPGVNEAVIPTSQSATEIKLTTPAMAVSGNLVLNTASGKTVSAKIETQKPSVTVYNPSPAQAGALLRMTGRNLDLVVSVTFNDNLVVPATANSATDLRVTVPLNAVSGAVVLTMANEETVECAELTIKEPPFAYLPEPPGPKAEIYAGQVLTVEVGNGDKLTEVQINGASVNFIHDTPKLYIVIPGHVGGETELKLVSSNGSAVYKIPVIGAGVVETVIWEGLWTLQWGDCPRLNKHLFEGVPAGARLKVYLTVTRAGGADLAFIDANWGKLMTDHPDSKVDGTVAVAEGSKDVVITLTAEILQKIRTTSDGWSQTAMMLQGDGAIVSKVSILTGSEPAEEVVWTGDFDPAGWANWLNLSPSVFEMARVGMLWVFYCDVDMSNGWAMIDIQNDSWSQFTSVSANAGGLQEYEIEITQTILSNLMAGPIHISGANLKIKKITLRNKK